LRDIRNAQRGFNIRDLLHCIFVAVAAELLCFDVFELIAISSN